MTIIKLKQQSVLTLRGVVGYAVAVAVVLIANNHDK